MTSAMKSKVLESHERGIRHQETQYSSTGSIKGMNITQRIVPMAWCFDPEALAFIHQQAYVLEGTIASPGYVEVRCTHLSASTNSNPYGIFSDT
jgi:hypothetical protein